MLTTLDKRADRAYQLCCASRFLLVSCVLHTVNIALHHYLAQLQHTQRKTASTATKICYASKSLGITVVALSRSYVPYISPHATARAEKREYEDIWTGAVFYYLLIADGCSISINRARYASSVGRTFFLAFSLLGGGVSSAKILVKENGFSSFFVGILLGRL